jgi:hypothetical protein
VECHASAPKWAVANVLNAVERYHLHNTSYAFTAKCLGQVEPSPFRIDASTLGSKGRTPYNKDAEAIKKHKKEVYKKKKKQADGMDQD